MLHAVIMAGGSGTRLWPECRRDRPKQLLRFQGDQTMLEATIRRIEPLVPIDNIVIATTEHLAEPIRAELPFLPRDAVLAEPMPRNTAPCIGLAAVRIIRDDPDATMLVMPSDHLIEPTDAFCQAVQVGVRVIDEDQNRLVTFGVRPTYASTSFGYIERAEQLKTDALADFPELADVTFRVRRFREKPGHATAQEYVASGQFNWNAGIFMWKAQTILDLLLEHEPSIYERLMTIAAAVERTDFPDVLTREFDAMKNISIDYAVMERAEEVVMIETPFEWDDVGVWRSLERLHKPDADGNLLDADRCIAIRTKDSIVRGSGTGRVIALLGVRDLIVVETPDATLIADKNHEESVRKVIDELKQRGWDEYL